MRREVGSIAELRAWFSAEVERLWPVAVGSLSLRKSPCVRKACHACATGEKHASYILYVRREGTRSGIYVPDELVPQVRHALPVAGWAERELGVAA